MPFCPLLEEASVCLKLAYFFHLTSQWKTQTLPTELLLSNLNYQHSVYKEHEHVLLLSGTTEEDTFNCYISCVGCRGLNSDDYTAAGKKLPVIKLETNTILKGILNFRKQMPSHISRTSSVEINFQSNRNAAALLFPFSYAWEIQTDLKKIFY